MLNYSMRVQFCFRIPAIRNVNNGLGIWQFRNQDCSILGDLQDADR